MTITSKEINLTQLTQELDGRGLIADFNDPKKKIILAADGVDITDAELKAAIDAHVAIDDVAVRAAARQAIAERLGLTADELQVLLG
jgi:hypothetical protein